MELEAAVDQETKEIKKALEISQESSQFAPRWAEQLLWKQGNFDKISRREKGASTH